MPYWSPPLRIDGNEIDLSHLEPFEFPVIPTGSTRSVTVSVKFHDHCFTETFDPDRHAMPIKTPHSSVNEQRAFCAIRYLMSKSLINIIKNLDGNKIASAREGNLVKVTLENGKTYPMFFKLKKVNANRVEMFVISAYVWERIDPPAITGVMKFNVAIAKVLKGEKPKFPKR